MIVIGLTGRKRSGKSTVAGYLESNYGFTRMGFADPLRRMALEINPIIHGYATADTPDTRLVSLVENVGWTKAKEDYPEVRRFLQRLGTDGVRNVLGQNAWIDNLQERAEAHVRLVGPKDARIVVDDVRFLNEAGLIGRAFRGTLVRVVRPHHLTDQGPYPPIDDLHLSEIEMNDMKVDYTLINNRSRVNLYHNVDIIMTDIIGG